MSGLNRMPNVSKLDRRDPRLKRLKWRWFLATLPIVGRWFSFVVPASFPSSTSSHRKTPPVLREVLAEALHVARLADKPFLLTSDETNTALMATLKVMQAFGSDVVVSMRVTKGGGLFVCLKDSSYTEGYVRFEPGDKAFEAFFPVRNPWTTGVDADAV